MQISSISWEGCLFYFLRRGGGGVAFPAVCVRRKPAEGGHQEPEVHSDAGVSL